MTDRKKLITCLVPIYAHAKFSIEKPDDWDQLTDELKREAFKDKMYTEAQLCHRCSHGIETDREAVVDWLDNDKAPHIDEFWEEVKDK